MQGGRPSGSGLGDERWYGESMVESEIFPQNLEELSLEKGWLTEKLRVKPGYSLDKEKRSHPLNILGVS